MSQSSHKLSIQANALSIQDSSTLMQLDQKESTFAMGEPQNGGLPQGGFAVFNCKRLQDDLHAIGLKIKQHEDNIEFLKAQGSKLDESIRDLQVILGQGISPSTPKIDEDDHSDHQSEEETTEQILSHAKSAAGIFSQMKVCPDSRASQLTSVEDVLGIVATLGKVHDENLSRLFSEYLGVETMLAIVCHTYEGVKALETHDKDGCIDKSAGIHGLGASLGRELEGRFRVICLESLRPFPGQFVADDPQRKLDLLKPRLPNGECPSGFLGFAVNMIYVDYRNLFYVRSDGHGLRETLFYNLFAGLQVYKTRADMILALPCISDGALSLDGGMIMSTGVFALGRGDEVGVRFPKPPSTSNLPDSRMETEKQMSELRWNKEKLVDDIKREEALLDNAKINFVRKKNEFVRFLAQGSSYATQMQAARERMTPR